MGIPEGEKREKGAERLFKGIIAENFPNLRKQLDIQVHKANKTSYYLNTKRLSPRNTLLKPLKVNDSKKILQRQSRKK